MFVKCKIVTFYNDFDHYSFFYQCSYLKKDAENPRVIDRGT